MEIWPIYLHNFIEEYGYYLFKLSLMVGGHPQGRHVGPRQDRLRGHVGLGADLLHQPRADCGQGLAGRVLADVVVVVGRTGLDRDPGRG